jgi:hypothetical protein
MDLRNDSPPQRNQDSGPKCWHGEGPGVGGGTIIFRFSFFVFHFSFEGDSGESNKGRNAIFEIISHIASGAMALSCFEFPVLSLFEF